MNTKKRIGTTGEQYVADYLIARNFTVLAQNFRKRDGEVDLIARKGDLAVFVEVKTRHNPLIDPAEVITRTKQRRIIRAAQSFIAYSLTDDVVCRFDVALVFFTNNDLTVSYIADAFQADENA